MLGKLLVNGDGVCIDHLENLENLIKDICLAALLYSYAISTKEAKDKSTHLLQSL